MDAAPDDDLLADVTRRLRSRGERMTTPRRAVLQALVGADHLTADQVQERVDASHPGVHRVSVYRTLQALGELGVVQHVHLGHGPTTYHLIRREDGDHPHAHCRSCGVVVDLPPGLLDDVRRSLADSEGFVLDVGHVALSGTCAGCAAVATPPG